MRRPAVDSRLRSMFALAWLAQLFRRRPSNETALATYSPLTEEMIAFREAQAEVELLTPGNPGFDALEQPRAAVSPAAFALVAGAVVGTLGAGIVLSTPNICTWADGTQVQGTCMFADEFSTGSAPDSTVWLSENTFPGPLLETNGEFRCFRQENATVTAGELRLLSTANARGSCPHAGYTPSAYSIANYPTMQPGATTVDIAAITTKTFKMKYGTIELQAQMPSSGGDVSLWGTDCRFPSGVVDGLEDLFQMASGRTCNYPFPGAREMDVIQNSGATLNTSWYRNSGDGGTLVQNWTGVIPPGLDLYGDLWSTHGAIANSKTFIADYTPTDPTTNFHTYTLEWYPRWIALYIDGTRVSFDLTDAVPTEFMFPMLWTIDNVASSFRVKYFRVWCRHGSTCEWSGGL